MGERQFSSLISYYDFIDFEGDVLYYNEISNQIDGGRQAFFDMYSTGDFIVTQAALSKLSKLILPHYKDDFCFNIQSKFVEGQTVVRVV